MKTKTGTKIKFVNNFIEKIKIDEAEFLYFKKAGKTKFRKRKLIFFDVTKKTILKSF